MGRIKPGRISKRGFSWGTIEFVDKWRIMVEAEGLSIIFHRYGMPKSFYKNNWEKFRAELMRTNLKNLYDVYKYANRYEITHYVSTVKIRRSTDAQDSSH